MNVIKKKHKKKKWKILLRVLRSSELSTIGQRKNKEIFLIKIRVCKF
jgi:hypothetical protein